MIIHIIRQGENVLKIIDHYGLTKSELVSENRHITDWQHLKPGTKIKIPVVNNNTIEILEETEPFIEEYYPKIDEEAEVIKEQAIKEHQIYKEQEEVKPIFSEEIKPDSIDKPKIPKKEVSKGYIDNYRYPRGIRKI